MAMEFVDYIKGLWSHRKVNS